MAVRKPLLALPMLLFLQACAPHTPTTGTAALQLKAIKDDWWHFYLRESPESATVLGEYQYNDKLTDISLAHQPQIRQEASGLLARVEAVDPKGLSEADQLDQSLLSRTLTDQIEGIDLKIYEMPVDQYNGLQI